jgi:hypothetical protein
MRETISFLFGKNHEFFHNGFSILHKMPKYLSWKAFKAKVYA